MMLIREGGGYHGCCGFGWRSAFVYMVLWVEVGLNVGFGIRSICRT